MLFRQLFDAESSTYTYLLADPSTRDAVIIDPVIEQVDRDATLIAELGLTLRYALDTHVHADHVTGAGLLRERLRCQTVLSERAGVGCADVLVKHGDTIAFGAYRLEVRETPGHTSSCLSYVTADQTIAFTGDALLIRGCGRTDFQQGDARQLYQSVHRELFSLPPTTLIYPAHDYKGRTATSIDEEVRHNPRLGAGKTEEEFVTIMENLQLAYPRKIDVALPRNLHCGTSVQAADPQLVSGWYPIVSAAGVPEVTAPWLAEHMREVRVVDVRASDELRGELGHIPGVEHVPLSSIPSAIHPEDRRPIIVVCRSGGRSAKAVHLLHDLGVERVASLAGGMTAWKHAGLPSVVAA